VEFPNSKFQIPKKSQIPNSNNQTFNLKIVHSVIGNLLVIGTWSLVIPMLRIGIA